MRREDYAQNDGSVGSTGAIKSSRALMLDWDRPEREGGLKECFSGHNPGTPDYVHVVVWMLSASIFSSML